jgi:hypothetical protein
MAKQGLWANINRRKKLGISRPKSESTISPKAYANMKAGFPKRKKMAKGGIARGYNEQSSQEIFKIVNVKRHFKIPLYVLSNYRGDETIKGSFYPFELVKVKGDVFRVEKVIKRRKYRGKNQLFVKWKGFDDTYNSWIDGTDVQQVYPN